MITQLTISNFALIGKLSLELQPGFSIITGETGAGKSILLGALGLVLGKRADLSATKDESSKCVIEVHFDIRKYQLKPFFESIDVDYDDHTIVRREILPTGKSRAFINDSPVNLQHLQDLGERLVDIHSQHQTLSLSDDTFQFELIDAFASNHELRQKFSGKLQAYKLKLKQLRNLEKQRFEAEKEKGYQQFLFEELEAARLREGEQLELEQSLGELSHAETIQETLGRAIAIVDSGEFGLRQSLQELRQSLQKIAQFSTAYHDLSERVSSISIEMSDITSELEDQSQRIVQDPIELERVSQRLQVINDLQKKHQVNSELELLEIQQRLSDQAAFSEDLDDQIAILTNETAQLLGELEIHALDLHERRSGSAGELTKKLVGILGQLGMPDSQMKIAVTPSDALNEYGKDDIQMLFSANKGIGFQPLKKVASGGELSRIMLAVKATLAEFSNLPTLIFDEIDTGVSGEIADRMAGIMKQMSAKMQIISITHLPQIAAKGDRQFKVFKFDEDGVASSGIRLLSSEERVKEIAQMLSGSTLSDSAINHARALLN